MLPQAEPFGIGVNARFAPIPNGSAMWKVLGHGATAPARESRRQPGCGRNRLTPGLRGRGPVSPGTRHAVGPTRIICSDSL